MRPVLNALTRAYLLVRHLAVGSWESVRSLTQQRTGRHHLAIIAAAVVVFGYALSVLGYVMFTPEIGIRCAFTPVVNHFYKEFLYPTDQEPLCPGDRIVQVGDHPIDDWSQLLRELSNVRRTPPAEGQLSDLNDPELHYLKVGSTTLVRVDYLRGDPPVRHHVWCAVGPPRLETLVPSVLWFFLKIGLFVVGRLGVLEAGRGPCGRPVLPPVHRLPRCLHRRLPLVADRHTTGAPARLHGERGAAAGRGAALLHAVSSPQGRAGTSFPGRPGRHLRAAGFLPLAAVSPGICGSAGSRIQALAPLLQEMLWEIYVYFGVALVWYLASIVCLIHSLRRAANAMERNQVKWILFGALAALVPIGYSLYLAYMQQDRFGGGAATWPMFAASACVTVAFTISITRYRLMQLDQIISSGVGYFLISTLVGLIYYGLVFVGVVLVGRHGADGPSLTHALGAAHQGRPRAGDVEADGPSLTHALGAAGVTLVLLVVLDLVARPLQGRSGPPFPPGKISARPHSAPHAPGHRPTRRPADPGEPVTADLDGTARRPVGGRLPPPGQPAALPPRGRPRPGPGTGRVVVRLSGGRGPGSARQPVGPPPRGPPRAGPAATALLGGEVAQALAHEGQLLGLLVLGPKDGAAYSPDDLTLLTAFAQLSALALVSAEGHRTIESLNRELQVKVEKIAEQQRRILALQTQLTQKSEVRGQKSEVREGPKPQLLNADFRPLTSVSGVVGSSPQVRQLMGLVKKVAASPSAVLLRGESGTGKEVLARALHENSPRAAKPFIKVHCGALAPGLLESELFGHVKGAFTGALRDKVGRFEAAHGGTLFLDEIGDITLDVQTKLLRVLQEMTLERVGSSDPIKVDVRIIAATHQDLEELIRQGRFREDLFYRLNVFPIRVPPLRERVEDIPELTQHFLKQFGQRPVNPVTAVNDDALVALKSYRWPGNIRELENVVERAVVIAEGSVITTNELPLELLENAFEHPVRASTVTPDPWGTADVSGVSLPELAGAVKAEHVDHERRKREHLVRALAATGGNKAEAARALRHGAEHADQPAEAPRIGIEDAR